MSDSAPRTPERDPRPPRRGSGSEYPIWFRMLVVLGMGGALAYNLVIRGDAATSLALIGLIGTALGLNEVFGRRSREGDE